MVKKYGDPVLSRHGDTMELLDTQVESPPGEMLDRENTNYNVGYCEAMALIAGVYDIHALMELAPNAQHVLFTREMAYGPRTTLQVQRIIDKLTEDPWTRQAVLFVGKPEDGATDHQPCTTTMHFVYRRGQLRCAVRMRSNDVIKGTPADLIMFHALNMVMAHCLGWEPGPVTLSATSSHVYSRDSARQIKPTTRRFFLASCVPRDFATIRNMAHEHLRNPSAWPKAEGRSHRVPPLFREELILQNAMYGNTHKDSSEPLIRPQTTLETLTIGGPNE